MPARSPRPVQGRSSSPNASGVIRQASSSPSRSRNSQRYRSPVTCMKVAARAGSQICSTPSQVSRPPSTRMSTTSQRSVNPQVFRGDPGQLPDGAVGAVTAQHDRAGEGLRLLVDEGAYSDGGRGERASGALDPADLRPAAEVDQRV